jgi:Asp-tRNA(Asn)/Glu-tRNA(Gln) amidotransferase A subunit family amidase
MKKWIAAVAALITSGAVVYLIRTLKAKFRLTALLAAKRRN